MFFFLFLVTAEQPGERAALVDQLGAIAAGLNPQVSRHAVFSLSVDASGKVSSLLPPEGSPSVPESWLPVFHHYEPYQEGVWPIEANVERTLLVPTTVTVQVAGADAHAAAALFEEALAGIGDCALPNENTRHLVELSMAIAVNSEGGVADAQTSGGPPSLRSCVDSLVMRQHLPDEYAGKHLRLDFSVDAGPARVTLRLKEAPQPGQLDPKEIKRVIQGARKAIRDCHEQGLIRDPHLGGTLHVRFLVQRDGHVSSPTLDSTTMNDSGVERCVVAVVSGLIFPQPKGGVVIVDYPFVFRAAL